MNKPDSFDTDLDALFAEARKNPPDTFAAQHAFETRLWAHLRAKRENDSIWTMASWRLIPFLGAIVIALTIWHSQVVAETVDAEQAVYADSPVAPDSWSNLD